MARSAVLVATDTVEPLVRAHRARFDVAASWGVPAHVTVVHPFVDPAALDEAVLGRLAAAVATVDAFDCVLARTAWFGEDVLWLAPEPDGGFRALTDAVVAAFPQYPPYGGVFDDVVPHLTIGETRLGSRAELDAAEQAVRARLPVALRVDHVLVMAGAEAPDSWRTVRRLPLGGV